jgi:alpha-N-acetylglucosaminidase
MLAKLPDRGISASAEARQEFPTVVDLAQRVVPWLAPDLLTRRIPRDQGHDVFEISTAGGKLIVRASDVPSAAEGLNWYLKYYCHRSISHLGNNIGPVEPLPQIQQPVRHTARFGKRYYLNYTTFNYTFSFADWRRWEHELDWMALNGVNLALATIGTEAVWQNTLRRVGYDESEVLAFLPGPAYTAWWLIGNLEGWGGPVTESMIDERVEPQRKILARMRELGIEPVLQGFYGMVPASLEQKFPLANIADQGEWAGFRRPPILLSSDPLFTRLASIYCGELRKLYGPVRYFGGDLFHEGPLDEPTTTYFDAFFTTPPDVFFGHRRGLNPQVSGGQLAVTAPPSFVVGPSKPSRPMGSWLLCPKDSRMDRFPSNTARSLRAQRAAFLQTSLGMGSPRTSRVQTLR